MPYWFEDKKLKIPYKEDRRRHLTEEDKEDIKMFHYDFGLGIREISRLYENKCSRRMIQFVLFPERLEKVKSYYSWKKYYTKKKRAEYMRKYRKHCKELFGIRRKNGNQDKL